MSVSPVHQIRLDRDDGPNGVGNQNQISCENPYLLPWPKMDKCGLYYQKWTGNLYKFSLDHLDHLPGDGRTNLGQPFPPKKNWPDTKNNLDNFGRALDFRKLPSLFLPLKLPSTWASAASEPYQPRIVALFGNFFLVKPLGMFFHSLCKNKRGWLENPLSSLLTSGIFFPAHVWFPKGEHIITYPLVI